MCVFSPTLLPVPRYTMELRKPPPPEGIPTLKLLSWNVAGLRALIKKVSRGAAEDLVQYSSLCCDWPWASSAYPRLVM